MIAMRRATVTSLMLGMLAGSLLLGGCATTGSPFAAKKPFVATPVPADFALVLNENVDTFYARQHVHQVVTASDQMSRTTYTTFRDYNNTVADQYTQESPVTEDQLQAMWNDVRENNLMKGGWLWRDWTTNASNYRSDKQTLEIRAGGQQVAYTQVNYWTPRLQDLVLQAEGVRFGVKGRNTARPPTQPETQPATQTGAPAAATEPAPTPTSEPVASPRAGVGDGAGVASQPGR